MRIVVSSDSPARLEDSADFARFSIQLDQELRPVAGRALASIGALADDGHAWVRPDAVRALAHGAKEPTWETSFRGMIDFAASKGWTSSAGEIRAHIDYVERPLPVSRETFCGALRRFASGVSVVAAGEGRNRRGMTVSAFSSVSAEPPTVLVCINAESSSHDSIVSADTFSVNILSGHQRPVALLFAGHTGVQGADRFEEDSWEQGVHGAPVLEGALQSLICAKTAGYRAGTHTILIGRVVEATTAGDGPALVNFNGSLLDMAGALNDEMPCFRKRA